MEVRCPPGGQQLPASTVGLPETDAFSSGAHGGAGGAGAHWGAGPAPGRAPRPNGRWREGSRGAARAPGRRPPSGATAFDARFSSAASRALELVQGRDEKEEAWSGRVAGPGHPLGHLAHPCTTPSSQRLPSPRGSSGTEAQRGRDTGLTPHSHRGSLDPCPSEAENITVRSAFPKD